jgi:hypothetical protein
MQRWWWILALLTMTVSCAHGPTLEVPLSEADGARLLRAASERPARVQLEPELWDPIVVHTTIHGVSEDGSHVSTLSAEGDTGSLALDRVQLISFPRSRPAAAVRGGALGLLAGAGLGFLMGCAYYQCGDRDFVASGGLIGAGVSAFLGLVFGDPGPSFRFGSGSRE